MGRDQGWGRVVKAFSKNTPPPVRHHGLILIRPASSRVSQISLQGGNRGGLSQCPTQAPPARTSDGNRSKTTYHRNPLGKTATSKAGKDVHEPVMLNTYKQLFKDNETPVNIIPELAFICVEGESEQSGGLAIFTNIYIWKLLNVGGRILLVNTMDRFLQSPRSQSRGIW